MPRIQNGWVTVDSGAYLGHFRKGGKPAPAVRLGSTKEMTLTQAREKLRTILVQELGIVGDGKLTLEGFVKARWTPLHEGEWRPSSRATVLGVLKMVYSHFDGIALQDIDAVMLQTFVNRLAEKYSGSTVKMARAYLRSIFAEAVEQDLLRKNPARLLRMPKQLRAVKHPYLSLEEIKTLLDAATPLGVRTRELVLLRVILSTGMRPSELFALRWGNVNLADGTLRLTQTIHKGKLRPFTKTTREGENVALALPGIAVDALTEWSLQWMENHPTVERLDDEAFVFPNSDGGFIDEGNYLVRVLQPMAMLAGIKTRVTFQVLRRTVATHTASFANLKDVQSIMRHKQASTTQDVYVQVLAPSVRSTVEELANKIQ